MPFTDAEKIKILETFLIAEDYDDLGTLLNELPNQLDVNTVRNAYTSQNDMLNKINEYANTHEGRDKITELFEEVDNIIVQVNNKLTENVNTFWNTPATAAGGTRKTYKKKTKHRRSRKNKRQKSKKKRRQQNKSKRRY